MGNCALGCSRQPAAANSPQRPHVETVAIAGPSLAMIREPVPKRPVLTPSALCARTASGLIARPGSRANPVAAKTIMHSPFQLERFVDAQNPVMDAVRAELLAGRKRTHWMWFVFPQIAGLGRSEMARHFALSSLEEATAYLDHPVLGARLRECSQIVADQRGKTAHELFGSPDDLKFHSCMTLFQRVRPEEPVFSRCLEQYFDGLPDVQTLALLAGRLSELQPKNWAG